MATRAMFFGCILAVCVGAAVAAAQVAPCPGYQAGQNTNLACEIPTATRASGQGSSLALLPSTVAAQLSQLPTATAVSGSGLTFSRALGVFTASTDSLGTILTQRGETLGKHKFYVSFTYQHFGFDSIDGIDLHKLPTVNKTDFTTFGQTSYAQSTSNVDLSIHQYVGLVAFGLTSRIDVAAVVPFSTVNLATTAATQQFSVYSNGATSVFDAGATHLAGSATGVGDLTVNVKANLLRRERASIAVGSELRFATGDESNYLGSGAYGVRPYFIFSHRGRLTESVNIGYQWNGRSALYADPATGEHLRLPGAFMYSGGLDFRVARRVTLTGEFLGQYVINGPRLATESIAIPGAASYATVMPYTGSYAMNNAGGGIKLNPFKGLLISGSVLFKLDDPGLRARFVPLVGISYRF